MRQPKIITTLRDYSWSLFRADLAAGTTVALVAIPLSIAIAIASGASPEQGLLTAIIGGFMVSLLGGSRVQIGGPTGAFIVVVYGTIAEHGYDGLVLATLMAGILLLIAGYFRAGRLIAYVPEAVIQGFTMGIAVIIATSQIADLFGLKLDENPADFLEKLPALWHARETFLPAALAVGLAAMAMIVVLRKLAPRLPGIIVAVALASVAAALLAPDVETIGSRFGELASPFAMPTLPAYMLERIPELLPSAVVIAFLAGIESLLSAVVADNMIKGHHRPNAELLAQGAANLTSSLFGGLPVTGAIARTATNVRAGGKTPVAGIAHAVIILVLTLLAAPLVGYLAMPALAAILVLTAWNMSEPSRWPELLKRPASDKFLLLVTLVLTVVADLTIAIAVGVALGLALRLRQHKSPPEDFHPRQH
jgi:SulP family sulfate permease